MPGPHDGIEIHYDEKQSYLSLGCEPDAFAPYRKIARSQLADFEEIPVDSVREIRILDVEAYVAWRDRPRKRVFDWVFGLIIIAVLGLAVIGAFSLLSKLFG